MQQNPEFLKEDKDLIRINGSIEKKCSHSVSICNRGQISAALRNYGNNDCVSRCLIIDWPLAVRFILAVGVGERKHLKAVELNQNRCWFLRPTPKHKVWRLKVHRVAFSSIQWSLDGRWFTFPTARKANYWNGEKHITDLFIPTLSDVIIRPFNVSFRVTRADLWSKRPTLGPLGHCDPTRWLESQWGWHSSTVDVCDRQLFNHGHRPFVLIKL